MRAFALDAALRSQISAEARAAYPRECCGLIEGVDEGGVLRATLLYPAVNLAAAPDRFEIDPVLQFRLMRERRNIVGCYHSHPDGAAEPSPRDAEYAFAGEFVWLIAGSAGRLAAYAWDGARFMPVPMPFEGSS